MYELKKRAQTMGGNAIGIQDLNENKEVTFTNHRTEKKNSHDVVNTLIKETNLLSSVTADIFKSVPLKYIDIIDDYTDDLKIHTIENVKFRIEPGVNNWHFVPLGINNDNKIINFVELFITELC